MVTGYEAGMYRDISRIAENLSRIVDRLDRIAEVMEATNKESEQDVRPTELQD